MRHIKKIISTITELALILSMHSGCGMFTNYKAIAEQALEDKYGEEFICYSTWDEGGITFSAEVAPEYDESMRFFASISPEYKEVYTDKYPEVVVGKQIADMVYSSTENIWDECYIKVSINGQGLDFTSKSDISIQSFYRQVNNEIPNEPSIHIVVNIDKLNEIYPNHEYETLVNIVECLQIDSVHFCLYFIDNNAYSEYKLWFSSTHDIYSGSFKDRADFKNRLTINIDGKTGIISMTNEEYCNARKETEYVY